MFKEFSLSKLIMLAVTIVCLLSPAALAAMPLEPAQSSHSEGELAQSGSSFTMFHSYNFGSSGPSNCPFPQRFRAGTRRVYSYASIVARVDQTQAIAWYALDNRGNFVSDRPFAISRFRLEAGDGLPVGTLSFNQNVSGNVAVFLFIHDGSQWLTAASGAYRIVAQGESAPEPGRCRLE